MDLGAHLKAVRLQHKLSQRELAKRAGVTNATVSLIESNRMNPSVGSLKRVLSGIPMSLSEFFTLDEPEEERYFFRASELTEIGKGPLSLRQVGADLSSRSLQILSERYAPGADTGKTMLSHRGEEGGIVVSGSIEVTVGNQRRILYPGDAYLYNSRLPHRFRNVGNEDCMLISVCTPPTF
jgi:transcriptional regulator with XRE-family HTH domain